MSSVENVRVGSIGTAVVSFTYSLLVRVASANFMFGAVAMSFLAVAQAKIMGEININMKNVLNLFIYGRSKDLCNKNGFDDFKHID